MNTPETQSDFNKQPLSNRVGRKAGIAALALVAGVVGGGIVGIIEHDKSDVSKHEAIAIGQIVAYNAVSAESLAEHYTQEVQAATTTDANITDMQFLNGKISEKDNDGYGYQDPIVLGLFSETGRTDYDTDGKFLVGAYLGVESAQADGSLKIDVIPYDAANDSFVPNDKDNMIINPTVYVQNGKNGAAIYAYDVNKQATLTNSDGSVFSPSLIK